MSIVDNRDTMETHNPKPMIPMIEVGAPLVINEKMIPIDSPIELYAEHIINLERIIYNLNTFAAKRFGGKVLIDMKQKIRDRKAAVSLPDRRG